MRLRLAMRSLQPCTLLGAGLLVLVACHGGQAPEGSDVEPAAQADARPMPDGGSIAETDGGAVPETDGGSNPGTDAGSPPPPENSGGCGAPAPARTINVTSLSDLRNQIEDAQPGDEIVLADGTYTASSNVRITASGTASQPIVIRAQTIGGATIAGSYGFEVQSSSHVFICGFRFQHRTWSTGGSFELGLLVKSSNHVRVTRNYFSLGGSDYAHWLLISGTSSDNRVDHNQFENRTSEGLFIGVYGASGGLSQRDQIDHNYFHQHLFTGEGGESIRVGSSGSQLVSAYTVIESNLFDEAQGDAEAISNKASDNVIRFNTFRNQGRGSVVLRHGHRATVEGNFFLGGRTGIRIYGDDHVIRNNYFAETRGTSGSSPIVLGSGDVTDGYNGHAGYDRPERVKIVFNTLIDNASNIIFGHGGDTYGPVDTVIANNLVRARSGTTIVQESKSGAGTEWGGNIFFGGSVGAAPSSAYRRVDPLLSPTGELYRIGSASPAIDSAEAVDLSSQPTVDMDGQARAGALDVGADEQSTADVARRPLTPSDVGPLAP